MWSGKSFRYNSKEALVEDLLSSGLLVEVQDERVKHSKWKPTDLREIRKKLEKLTQAKMGEKNRYLASYVWVL